MGEKSVVDSYCEPECEGDCVAGGCEPKCGNMAPDCCEDVPVSDVESVDELLERHQTLLEQLDGLDEAAGPIYTRLMRPGGENEADRNTTAKIRGLRDSLVEQLQAISSSLEFYHTDTVLLCRLQRKLKSCTRHPFLSGEHPVRDQIDAYIGGYTLKSKRKPDPFDGLLIGDMFRDVCRVFCSPFVPAGTAFVLGPK